MLNVFDTNAVTDGRADKPRKVNLFETPRCFVDVHVLRPGQVAKVHAHAAEDKCYHVLSGEGVITLGDMEHRAGPGTLVHCPVEVPHGIRNDGAEILRVLVFMAPHPRPQEVEPAE